MAQIGATCGCGQVLFETDRYKPGETIHCPWCERSYRYVGDDKIEPLTAESAPISHRKKRDQETRREVPISTRSSEKVGEHSGKSSRLANSSTRVKRTGLPGGTAMMILFIVGFNALAFIAMFFIMPRDPSGIRLPVWGGDPIPKSAVWPELLALVVGHLLGFLFWSLYVFQLTRMNKPCSPHEQTRKP